MKKSNDYLLSLFKGKHRKNQKGQHHPQGRNRKYKKKILIEVCV